MNGEHGCDCCTVCVIADMHTATHRKTRSLDRLLTHAAVLLTYIFVTSLRTSYAQLQQATNLQGTFAYSLRVQLLLRFADGSGCTTSLRLFIFFYCRHRYKLFLPGCSSTTRHNYFTHRVARIWNNLPENSTNFSSLALFKRSLSLAHVRMGVKLPA